MLLHIKTAMCSLLRSTVYIRSRENCKICELYQLHFLLNPLQDRSSSFLSRSCRYCTCRAHMNRWELEPDLRCSELSRIISRSPFPWVVIVSVSCDRFRELSGSVAWASWYSADVGSRAILVSNVRHGQSHSIHHGGPECLVQRGWCTTKCWIWNR